MTEKNPRVFFPGAFEPLVEENNEVAVGTPDERAAGGDDARRKAAKDTLEKAYEVLKQ